MTACPKPESRKRINARKKRHESAVEGMVRAVCVQRDGYCKLAEYQEQLGPCQGDSEWAHVHPRKRFQTRKMAAEFRHTSAYSFMSCAAHHRAYDAYRFVIVVADAEKGIDGVWQIAIPDPVCWPEQARRVQ